MTMTPAELQKLAPPTEDWDGFTFDDWRERVTAAWPAIKKAVADTARLNVIESKVLYINPRVDEDGIDAVVWDVRQVARYGSNRMAMGEDLRACLDIAIDPASAAVAESAKHPEQPIVAQHDETGRMWRGQRCDLPARYNEVAEQPKEAPGANEKDLVSRLRDPNHSRVYGAWGARTLEEAATTIASQAERIEVLERLLREAQGHVKGYKMSMLARSSERLSSAIDAALPPLER